MLQTEQHLTEQYEVFEITLKGTQDGNPYTDSHIEASFTNNTETRKVRGFYDGDGIYKVRFMPFFTGQYNYEVTGDCLEMPYCGSFTVTPAKPGNHGIVRATYSHHFEYDDGAPYHPIGTTCYAWLHQPSDMREQTLETLKNSPFNKVRMCIFPKDYVFNKREPEIFPFPAVSQFQTVPPLQADATKEYSWDYTRFNPEYFRRIEHYIIELGKLGIEADLILFHPYDRWGFASMPADVDDRYLEYVLARFGAFHNVWWSLANEYDFMKEKTPDDWERYGNFFAKNDCYGHLIGVHNAIIVYNPDSRWLTHLSVQKQDICKLSSFVKEHIEKYEKPVILDEIGYEGNIDYLWGNLSPQVLVYRSYEAVMGGGYATHGETYYSDEEKIWWSHGGTLHGEAVPRLEFMKKLLSETPGCKLRPLTMEWDDTAACAYYDEDYMLFYYGFYRPLYRTFTRLDENGDYEVELIDTWNMTVTPLGVMHGQFRIKLPVREWMLVRVRKIKGL